MKSNLLNALLVFAFGNAVTYSTEINDRYGEQTQNYDYEKSKCRHIENEFWQHTLNIKNENERNLILQDKYHDSLKNICTEISYCMLGIDRRTNSMKYSDGQNIPEFIQNEGFKTLDGYENKNWNYLFLMNLLQDIKNSDIANIDTDEQKNNILDKTVLNIRNARTRNASIYEYDQWQYVEQLNKARNDIKTYFDHLNLWKFVLDMRDKYCTPAVSTGWTENKNPVITENTLPGGIYNEAATCYLNAVLQTLYNCTKIRNAIYELAKDPKNTLAFRLAIIFGEIAAAHGRYVDFRKDENLIGGIRQIAADVMGNDKKGNKMVSNQDPSEALIKIVERLVYEENGEDYEKIKKDPCEERDRKTQELMRNSKIGKACYFNEVSRVVCLKCHNAFPTNNIACCLNLSIPTIQNLHLQKLIEIYEKEESLNKDEKFYCNKCKGKQEASKRTILAKMPEVLCIILVRCRVDPDKGVRYIYDSIPCPEILEIRQYKYKLRSWMLGGRLRGGHIVMFGYADDGTLYKANDIKVEKIDNATLQSYVQHAQFLVYEREE